MSKSNCIAAVLRAWTLQTGDCPPWQLSSRCRDADLYWTLGRRPCVLTTGTWNTVSLHFKAHPSFLSSNWTVVYIRCCVWKVPHLWSFLLHRNRTPVWLLVSFLSTFKQALLAFGGFWNRKRSLNARADKQVAWFCHPHPRLQKLSSFIHGEKREGVGVIWH